MSYLVLARKWRPRRFAELVGQEHVVRALSHALDSGRVHQAFLFTGTRGVGKTTIARIFAKSLNCETGVGAEPCGQCAVCTAVDGGRFVDLIEIDAASNTGVDDVREVIENAQYLPTRGRYKVYLVDEVHMLSRNAFNALLKTLEEPPEHVKFLLATTDPQKLPVTVLSRCLQFNLKRLTEEQISGQIRHILGAEGIGFDERSLKLLARGADGSLRDGLSLLDQAIAYGSGGLRGDEVAQMLGSVEHDDIDDLLQALVAGDGLALYRAAEQLAGFSPDYSALLDAIASALHRVQLRQLVPAAADAEDGATLIAAAALPAELIQLWYQMAVSGRRELPVAPSPRVGFEMILLRMLAFVGDDGAGLQPTSVDGGGRAAAAKAAAALGEAASGRGRPLMASPPPATLPTPTQPTVRSTEPMPTEIRPPRPPEAVTATAAALPLPPTTAQPTARRRVADNEQWLALVAGLGLKGPAGQLAFHAQFLADDGDCLRLGLPETHDHLKSPALVDSFSAALGRVLDGPVQLQFGAARAQRETLHERAQRDRDARQQQAEADFAADPAVQRLVTEYGARIVADSVRPLDS